MSVSDEIQSAIKSGNAVIGYRESIKSLKAKNVKVVIAANNIPESMGAEIKHNSKTAGVRLEIFDGGSKDLGTACGKPFPVAVMAVKG